MHEERELTPEVATALADARLFHMFVPRSLGGRELPQPEYLPVVEALGYADASTGWCVNQGAVFMTTSAFIDRGGGGGDLGQPAHRDRERPVADRPRAPRAERLPGDRPLVVLERVPPRDVARRALGARRRAGGAPARAPTERWWSGT